MLDDADVETAAAGAVRGCFGNAGQLCVSIERIYVADALHDAFTSAFVAKTRTLRLGRSLDYEHEMGSLVSADQLDRVEAQVEDARSKGAQVLTGGRRRPDLGPLFYEPTVLTGVTEEMDCYAGETFGPVVSIYRVARRGRGGRAGERLRLRPERQRLDLRPRARSPGRRSAPLRHRQRQRGVRRRPSAASTRPMGGMKASGLGRRQGPDGLLRFVETQAIGTQSLIPLAPSLGLSPAAFVTGLTGALRVLKVLGRA